MGPQMELIWTLAPAKETARIGDQGAPLTDYMLNPPLSPGAQDRRATHPIWTDRCAAAPTPEAEQAACLALEALIAAALDP